MLSSLLNACVTPWFCCAPLKMWLVPHRGLCHGLGLCLPKAQKLTAGSSHPAVPGLGTSAMAQHPGCHFGHSSLPQGELCCSQAQSFRDKCSSFGSPWG